MPDVPGVVIIGCGGAASLFHAPGYQELARRGRCRLVACCDVVPWASTRRPS